MPGGQQNSVFNGDVVKYPTPPKVNDAENNIENTHNTASLGQCDIQEKVSDLISYFLVETIRRIIYYM